MLDTEFAVPTLFKLLPLFFTILLSLISIIFTEFFPKPLISFKLSNFGYNIFSFFNQRFLIELFYNKYITGVVLKLGGQTTKIMDKGSVELFGPYGLENKLSSLSRFIGNLSTGVVTAYALYILIGLIFYISILYFSKTPDNYLELLLISFTLISSSDTSKSISSKSPNIKLEKSTKNQVTNNNIQKRSFSTTKPLKADPFTLATIATTTVSPLNFNVLLFVGIGMLTLISHSFDLYVNGSEEQFMGADYYRLLTMTERYMEVSGSFIESLATGLESQSITLDTLQLIYQPFVRLEMLHEDAFDIIASSNLNTTDLFQT
jgi:hypothetical protein